MIQYLLLALYVQVADPELQHGGDAYWSGSGWTIYAYPDEQSCDLTVEFVNGEMLTLGYSAKNDSTVLVVTNKHATSTTHDQRVSLDIHMLSAGKIFRSWKSVGFTAKSHENAGRVFVSDDLGTSFLDAFGKAEMFGVFTKGNVVAGSSLNGSGVAIQKLISCSKNAGGIDPMDPFQQ